MAGSPAIFRNDVNLLGLLNSAGYGDGLTLVTYTAQLSALSGATATATNLIAAGTFVLGVVTRVTTLITASAGTGFTIGDGTTADRWGAAIALTAGTTTTGTAFKAATAPIQAYPANASVVLTMTGGSFTAGAVRIVVYGFTFTAPTA